MRAWSIVRYAIGVAAISVLLVTRAPRPAHADGGVFPPPDFMDIEMPAQWAIVVWDEERGHEDLVLYVELHGGPEAAWVVPVPALPKVRAASPKWFEQLSRGTGPKTEYRVLYHSTPGVEIQELEKEVVVELISRERVGVYDVSILSASEPGALLDWLNENGYGFPEEGGPIVDAYVEEGHWYFVAARVLPGERANLEGDVQPLWFSFDAERPVYPMRLTALVKTDVYVLIFVLADHRMELPERGFQTEFAGELTLSPVFSPELSDLDQEELVDLLTQRPYYITKLRHFAFPTRRMTEDLHFEQADSDEPHREIVHRNKWVYRAPATRAPTQSPTQPEIEQAPSETPTKRSTAQRPWGTGWLVLAVSLALLGVLAGLGLAWRRWS